MEVKNKQNFKAVALILSIGAILVWMIFATGESSPYDSIPVNSPEDAAAFLETLGWETNCSAAEVQDALLPTEFDAVFTEYNALQLDQGCDLTKYAGKSIQVYTIPVTNYPNTTDTVLATVIVHNSTVIGGDIHSAKLDGFMHGLK